MPLSGLGLALAAACLHACWNLLLARERDTAATTAVSLVVFVVVLAPIAAATWRIESGAWPYVGASAALELVYVVLLAAAYRRFELSLVYPLARGLAPVLALLMLRLASAPAVAAVRETRVVIAVVLARVVLAEPVGRRRLGGAALVVAGVVLLAVA